MGDQEEIRKEAIKEIEKLHKNADTISQYNLATMEIVSGFFKFCANNSMDFNDISGNVQNLYERVTQLDETSMTNWIINMSTAISEKLKSTRNSTSRRMITDAQNIVKQRYMEPDISLDEVCADLGVSNSYFSSIFKKETGQPFVTYLTDYRMDRAEELVLNTDEKSYKIAEKVGYQDANYFSYVFKKEIRRFPIQIQSLREKRKRKVEKVPYLTYRRSFCLSLWQSHWSRSLSWDCCCTIASSWHWKNSSGQRGSNRGGTVDRLNADLLDIRQIFNGANYNVVQQFDISSREFVEQFSLLYETNSDKVQSVALYDHEGKLIASEPVALEKKNVQVQTQEWYENAENAIENVHFSTPHIQELFEDGAYRYQWVVSLSSYVDVNKGEIPETGVLLLDMKYSVIRDVMKQINDSSDGIYYYLSSQGGEMIYHPRGTELNRGLFKENSLEATKYEDGTYEIRADGQNETVIVRSVAYTGWKMIGVVPESVQESNFKNFRYYVFATILVLLVMLLEETSWYPGRYPNRSGSWTLLLRPMKQEESRIFILRLL